MVLQADLGALYARLYGLSRDKMGDILEPADAYLVEFHCEIFRVLDEKEIRRLLREFKFS